MAPPQPAGPNSDDKTLAMISHAGLLAGGFVLPLIMYLISNDDDRPETRHHAREALNFQLTFLAVYLGAMFATMFARVVSSAPGPGDDFPLFPFAGMFLGFIGLFALFAVNIVFSVMGAVRANRGERWQYPVRIPFVRG